MIVIKMCGGIGNQMFQYALYTKFKEDGKEVYLDLDGFNEFIQNYSWNDIFNIFDLSYNTVQDSEKRILCDFDTDLISRIRRKLFGRKKTHVFENQEGNFEPEILEMKDAYLEGYWQSEKYFVEIKDRIRDLYQFKSEPSNECKSVMKLIDEVRCSVSIHVRRGDYLKGINNSIYGGICNGLYYRNAIEYLKKKTEKPTFFCFSNDIEFCKNNFKDEDFIFVDCNNEYNAWMDMMLMSMCKHNIIANSSFSWWGAWLNSNQDKIVVAPKKWLNTKEMKDICPEEWIRI